MPIIQMLPSDDVFQEAAATFHMLLPRHFPQMRHPKA